MNHFYVYAYVRSKDSDTAKAGTPYYIGKGKGDRAYKKHRNGSTPKNRRNIIIIIDNLTETEAFGIEISLISVYGRKDLGTGILINRTVGGEGSSGTICSDALRKARSERMTGKNNPGYGKTRSEETKELIRQRRLGTKGSIRTDEFKEIASKRMSGEGNHQFGNSGELNHNFGRVHPRFECPHCKKTGSIGNMNRWHFDNCKLNQINLPSH